MQHLTWEMQETRTRGEGALQTHHPHGDTCNPAQIGMSPLVGIASIFPDCWRHATAHAHVLPPPSAHDARSDTLRHRSRGHRRNGSTVFWGWQRTGSLLWARWRQIGGLPELQSVAVEVEEGQEEETADTPEERARHGGSDMECHGCIGQTGKRHSTGATAGAAGEEAMDDTGVCTLRNQAT